MNDNIMIHFKGEEEFVRRYLDIFDQVERQYRPYLSEFLSPYHQSIILSLIGRYPDLKVFFDGGIENAESKRCIIAPDYFEITKEDFMIDVFEVRYLSKFEKLKHSDVLGALMSIGLKRERFGDIVILEDAYFACNQKVSSLVMMELTSVRKAKVKLSRVDHPIQAHIDYVTRTFFVKSYRLDVLLAAFYHLSRSEVNRYIQAGFVKVNHKEVVEKHFLCNNNDVISFKHHGRVKLVDTHRTTRQGNYVVEGYFYK